MRRKSWLLFCGLLLLAFALRVYRLSAQSLWYDEGYSVHLARMSLAEATRWTNRDIVPPLYYYLLHGWRLLTGETEFALRFLSVGCGLLTVALGYRLGRFLFGAAAGLGTATLMAIAPLLIWYSQEARMYAALMAAGLAGTYALLRAVAEPERRRWWVLFTLSGAAALYLHTSALFLVATQGVIFLLAAWRARSLVFFRRGALGFAAIGLLYLPWALVAVHWLGVNAGYWWGTLELRTVLHNTLLAFCTGRLLPLEAGRWVAAGHLLLLLGAVVVLLRYRPSPPTPHPPFPLSQFGERGRGGKGKSEGLFAVLALLLYLLLPALLMALIFRQIPKFSARYLTLAAPPLFLLLGGALGILVQWSASIQGWGRIPLGGLVLLWGLFLVGSALVADAHNYWDPRYARTDFRGAAHYLEEHVEPGEVILLISGHTFPVFDYYYHGDNWHPLPDIPILNLRHTLNYSVAAELNRLLRGRTGVWVVGWQDKVIDPSEMVPWFLARVGKPLPVAARFTDLTLRHYALPADVHFPEEPAPQRPVGVRFGDLIELIGYDQAGDAVTLYWRALQEITRSYWLLLQLRDEAGLVWGKQTARPTTYRHPTKYWRAGEVLVGEHRLEPLSGTPPGRYYMEIGLYDEETLERLVATGPAGAPLGEAVQVGPVTLTKPAPPPTPQELARAYSLTADLNADLGVRGYGLWPRQVRAGTPLFLTLFWEARRPITMDYRVRLSLWDAAGQVAGERDYPLAGEDYPPSRWEPGRVVRGQYLFRVPVETTGGTAQLRLELVDMAGRPASEPVTVASVEVEAVEVRLQVPPMQHELGVRFGGWAELLGYDLAASEVSTDAPLRLVLYWRAVAPPPPTDFTVFTHLLNAEGVLIGQHDGPPAGATRPTSGWQVGEVIVDPHDLVLVDASYRGPARIEVGLYDPRSGQRVPVDDGGDHVVLPSLLTVK